MSRVTDEGREPIQAFKHDDAKAPPVARIRVAMSSYYFGGHVRVSPTDRVCKLPAVPLAPSENTALTVAASHQPFYLLAIQALGPHAVLQAGAVVVLKVDAMLVQKVQALLFVVGRVMRPVEIRGETKVTQFDVTFRVEQEVIWLDVPVNKTMFVA